MIRQLRSFLLLTAISATCLATAETNVVFPAKLKIVTRAEWNAKEPVGEMKPNKPQFITIHHTATKQNRNRTVEDKLRGLQAFSQREDKLASGKTKPAWPDVPYHFYVAVDGKIGEGRNVAFVPNTNTSYDPSGHITIVLEGNFEEEEPSLEQMASARALVTWLTKKYKIPAEKIGAHKDYTETACPGKHLHNKIAELRDAAGKPRKTKR